MARPSPEKTNDKPTNINTGKIRFQPNEERSRKNSIFRALNTAKKREKFI